MFSRHTQTSCCQSEANYFPKIVATPGPVAPVTPGVLGYGSLRGDTLDFLSPVSTPVTFEQVGPLSNVTVSPSGNELVVQNNGVYQITISINAQATALPDPDQPYFTVSITVNGLPIFLEGIAIFNVLNRSSSSYIVQATLSAGDLVGVSASSDSLVAGYASRSLTVIQIGG
ncbi:MULTISPECIES: hypothetical protein [Lysinibacillus]|jgi:hypothetical protein|uniref:BclA C-terminal domain-containing protein n=1 Tax=Lysinibacillus fusiformis TaxID=28031 RepID=A0A2I0UZV3_9BACI|nr:MULTISPECIES: hypothetical protein [Lysinibacillus]MEE3806378.1 hypothetical protein [Lysinibacillus fusiformis]PKU51607.1 hypothetical protein CRI88_12985 [Lysinibacillus fusiformis]WCH45886.1 hypothetical protein NV349_12300 [Lysinibacillus sp. OF-1]SCY36462.1 hypothetical protein SAMN02787078_01355 [Lysinibacillus sp. SG9]SDB18315.1 hypothetical protein SAMN02787079_01357 [Lysinibacillus sp. TC-37]